MFYSIAVAFGLSFLQGISATQTWSYKGNERSGELQSEDVDPDLCGEGEGTYSGYFSVSGKSKSDVEIHDSANYFYWFFESRSDPSTDPLSIWLTGGPGCSSMLALLAENGPCTVNADGTGTINNPYSWNSNSNIMWIDQPAQVGYSYGNSRDVAHNEEQVGEDLYWFLQEFMTAHPEYLGRDFFVFGESYGGHYVPAISYRIYQGNMNHDGLHIDLKGAGIGNGMTVPSTQYGYYAEMAMNNSYGIKTVSEEAYENMLQHQPTCLGLADLCQAATPSCEAAYTFCNMFETTPYYNTGLNPYDIRLPCEGDLCYDFSNLDVFLNLESTRSALHVSDEVKEWQDCNTAVNIKFIFDWMKDFDVPNVQTLLEAGIPVLAYSGDADFICNWLGNQAWTLEMDWSGHDGFNAAEMVPWFVGGVEAGQARAYDGLTFLRVYSAGHMVPMDQPQAALQLFNAFINGESFV